MACTQNWELLMFHLWCHILVTSKWNKEEIKMQERVYYKIIFFYKSVMLTTYKILNQVYFQSQFLQLIMFVLSVLTSKNLLVPLRVTVQIDLQLVQGTIKCHSSPVIHHYVQHKTAKCVLSNTGVSPEVLSQRWWERKKNPFSPQSLSWPGVEPTLAQPYSKDHPAKGPFK